MIITINNNQQLNTLSICRVNGDYGLIWFMVRRGSGNGADYIKSGSRNIHQQPPVLHLSAKPGIVSINSGLFCLYSFHGYSLMVCIIKNISAMCNECNLQY